MTLPPLPDERENFEKSSFEFPPLTVDVISAASSIDGNLDPKLQDYFWECGFAGWRAAVEAALRERAAPKVLTTAVPTELLRLLKHYTICHLMNFPSCGAPTEAEIDAALAAPAAVQPAAQPELSMSMFASAEDYKQAHIAHLAGQEKGDTSIAPAPAALTKALEFAEYMAKGAEEFLIAATRLGGLQQCIEDGHPEVTDEELLHAQEIVSEHERGLRSDIYEFRKRVERAHGIGGKRDGKV